MSDTDFDFLSTYGYEEDEENTFEPVDNYVQDNSEPSEDFDFLSTYGYEEGETVEEEEDPGFFDRMGASASGVMGGFAESGALLAGSLGFDEIEASLLESGKAFEEDSKIKAYETKYGDEGLEQFGNMLDFGWWKNTAAALLPGSTPFLAGATTGGIVGSSVPIVGTMIGAVIGGSLALLGQSAGQNYYDELERNGGDEDGARDYALLKTGAEVLINAASIPLGAASAGVGFAGTQALKTSVMNALLKISATEVVTENVDTVVGNLIDQAYVDSEIDWTRGMAEATAGGLLFDAPVGAAALRKSGKQNLSGTPNEIFDGLDDAQQEAMNRAALEGGDALDQVNAAAGATLADPRRDPNVAFGSTVDEAGNAVRMTREQLIAEDQMDTSENALLAGEALEQQITELQNPVTETLSIPGLAEKREGVVAAFPINRGMQQLSGAPSSKKFKPNKKALAAADNYRQRTGLGKPELTTYRKIDEEFATRIAEEFELMEHAPNDPVVKEAYEAMIKETLDQYQSVLDSGLQIEFIENENPYANPSEAIRDVTENNHLYVYSTKSGFGTDKTFDPTDNPLLAETEFQISGQPALANDIFRVVHDYFGHVKNGTGFRAEGEENAWQAHAGMYSDIARRAMTTETRGQNSWVNFGPFGEQNQTASGEKTIYADQKIGLLPEWASTEGALVDEIKFATDGESTILRQKDADLETSNRAETQSQAADRFETGKVEVQRADETDAAYAERAAAEETAKDADFDEATKQKNDQVIADAAAEQISEPEAKPLTPMQEAMAKAKAKKAEVDKAANEAATSPLNDEPIPSQEVLESGDYKKGQIQVKGLDIEIENPKGSVRSGTNADGKTWSVTIKNHYGSLKRTEGADGDAIDVFTGNNLESDKVFVIDQVNQKDGTFDEHKVMMGFNNSKTAKLNYKRNYESGWKIGPVTEMTVAEFKTWVKQSNTKLPVDESVELKSTEEQQSLDFDAEPTTNVQKELALPAPKTDAEVLREKGQKFEEDKQRPTRFSLAKSKKEGYEGNDKGESVEWLRAKEKGLSMDKPARMKRAKAMGFDTEVIYYHGTGLDVTKFSSEKGSGKTANTGVFLTDNPNVAGSYSKTPNPNIVKVHISNNNQLEIFAEGNNWNNLDESVWVNAPDGSMKGLHEFLGVSLETIQNTNELARVLKAKGYSSAVINDLVDVGPSTKGIADRSGLSASKVSIVFDTKNIRSVNAAFDPDFKDSGDLLSSAPDTVQAPVSKGVPKTKAKAAIKPLQDKMKTLGDDIVTIHETLADAPQELQDALKAAGRENSKGVFHNGQVHIFANKHTTEADVVKTFLHESVVHAGLRMTVPNIDGLLTEINANLENQADFQAIVEKYDLDITNVEERLEATEEYIASLAESGLDSPILQKVVDFVRKQLRKMGLVQKWSDTDIKALIRETSKALKGKPLNKITITTDATVAETGETVKIKSRADVAIRQIDKRVDICKKLKVCL